MRSAFWPQLVVALLLCRGPGSVAISHKSNDVLGLVEVSASQPSPSLLISKINHIGATLSTQIEAATADLEAFTAQFKANIARHKERLAAAGAVLNTTSGCVNSQEALIAKMDASASQLSAKLVDRSTLTAMAASITKLKAERAKLVDEELSQKKVFDQQRAHLAASRTQLLHLSTLAGGAFPAFPASGSSLLETASARPSRVISEALARFASVKQQQRQPAAAVNDSAVAASLTPAPGVTSPATEAAAELDAAVASQTGGLEERNVTTAAEATNSSTAAAAATGAGTGTGAAGSGAVSNITKSALQDVAATDPSATGLDSGSGGAAAEAAASALAAAADITGAASAAADATAEADSAAAATGAAAAAASESGPSSSSSSSSSDSGELKSAGAAGGGPLGPRVSALLSKLKAKFEAQAANVATASATAQRLITLSRASIDSKLLKATASLTKLRTANAALNQQLSNLNATAQKVRARLSACKKRAADAQAVITDATARAQAWNSSLVRLTNSYGPATGFIAEMGQQRAIAADIAKLLASAPESKSSPASPRTRLMAVPPMDPASVSDLAATGTAEDEEQMPTGGEASGAAEDPACATSTAEYWCRTADTRAACGVTLSMCQAWSGATDSLAQGGGKNATAGVKKGEDEAAAAAKHDVANKPDDGGAEEGAASAEQGGGSGAAAAASAPASAAGASSSDDSSSGDGDAAGGDDSSSSDDGSASNDSAGGDGDDSSSSSVPSAGSADPLATSGSVD